MIIDWNKAPEGTTHIYVPDGVVSNPQVFKELPLSPSHYEKWERNRVYQWNDDYEEWDLLSHSGELLNYDRRVKNPNIY